MKRIALAAVGAVVVACGGGADDAGGGDASFDSPSAALIEGGAADASAAADTAAADAPAREAAAPADAAGDAAPDPCADAAVPPSTLECTGLYSDFASQTLSPNVQAYAPAVPLWSDGATKERWIDLPPGQKIDATNPNEWVFPIGTKVFKQFTYNGVRVETRMFLKVQANYWVHATYAWNADATATSISYGATVPAGDGGTWVIPAPGDCDSCHQGRSDRILGFEQVSLGLEGATGLTLLQLVVQGLITPAPTVVNLRIGDDGTGLDAPALSWLHINCGVTCHNANEGAQGYAAGMLLRLDPSLLDGSQVTSSWDPIRTTEGVNCVSGSLAGQPRIVPGNASASVIPQLISERDGGIQMPPIASRFVDTVDVASVVDWIQRMPPVERGAPDASVDGSMADATTGDAGPGDAGVAMDATAAQDANVIDAAAVDGGGTADATAEGGGEAESTDSGADEGPLSGDDSSGDDGTFGDEMSTPDGGAGDDEGDDASPPDGASAE
jgi:hypothetical protein